MRRATDNGRKLSSDCKTRESSSNKDTSAASCSAPKRQVSLLNFNLKKRVHQDPIQKDAQIGMKFSQVCSKAKSPTHLELEEMRCPTLLTTKGVYHEPKFHHEIASTGLNVEMLKSKRARDDDRCDSLLSAHEKAVFPKRVRITSKTHTVESIVSYLPIGDEFAGDAKPREKRAMADEEECIHSTTQNPRRRPYEDAMQQPSAGAQSSRRTIRMKKRKGAKRDYASAISPSKKKALIEQSLRDNAIQQARGSKGPLTTIDNLAVHSSLSRMESKSPSPLRTAFSIFQMYRQAWSDSDTEDDKCRPEDPPSPLRPLRRCSSPTSLCTAVALEQTPTSSRRRIYALETQLNTDVDAAGCMSDLAVRGFDKEGELGFADRLRSSSQEMGRQDGLAKKSAEAMSSQTASGGSWSSAPQDLDDIVSEDCLSKCGGAWCGSVTCRSPLLGDHDNMYVSSGSASSDTLGHVCYDGGEKSTVPSRVDAAGTGPQDGAKTNDAEDLLLVTSSNESVPPLDVLVDTASQADADDETQPLGWNVLSRVPEALRKTQRQGPNQWTQLDNVWSGHMHISRSAKTASGRQSDLSQHGFTCVTVARNASQIDWEGTPMSEAEDVPSDDDEQEMFGLRSLQDNVRDTKRRLQWDADILAGDDGDLHRCKTTALSEEPTSSLPSISDLDPQLQRFLDDVQ